MRTQLMFETIKKKEIVIDPNVYEYLHNYVEIRSEDVNIILTYPLNDDNTSEENLKKIVGEKRLIKLFKKYGIEKLEHYILVNLIFNGTDRKYSFVIPIHEFNTKSSNNTYIQYFDKNFIEYSFNTDKTLKSFKLFLQYGKLKINGLFDVIVDGFNVGKNGFSSASKEGRVFGGNIVAPYCKVIFDLKLFDEIFKSSNGTGYHDKTLGSLFEGAKWWYWTISHPSETSNEVISIAKVINQSEFSQLGDYFQYLFQSDINLSNNKRTITDDFDLKVIYEYKDKIPLLVHLKSKTSNYLIKNNDVIDKKQGYVRMNALIYKISEDQSQKILNLQSLNEIDNFLTTSDIEVCNATSECLNIPSIPNNQFFGNIIKNAIKKKLIENDILEKIYQTKLFLLK